ncbi:MAG: hypothetical protein D3923_10130 [Candidatus Electrothrix sp. AR3]|nr:hypothetical protein [Candidatus Electrothrix sp. AR3]
MNDILFREQIKEDLSSIKDCISWDTKIKNDGYAFNYWILSNIYNLDIEECHNHITEYKDKSIDCFVHYDDDHELYIIQNKYYSDSTSLNPKDISDFLVRPTSVLDNNLYKRSPELQKIYNEAKKNKEYKIFLHFYVTQKIRNNEADNIVKNNKDSDVITEIFYLDDIHDKYYGKTYKETDQLKTTIGTINKGTYLAIRPEEYDLPNMSKAFYVMTNIVDIFKLLLEANKNQYPLFEENIREYLGGTSGINKKIIMTLKDPKERDKFFYYNNGITIICDTANPEHKKVSITNPQIVNGCQTVNSIAEVLKNYDNIEAEFKEVFVMAKILVLRKNDERFYRDIVRYTNSQNSITEKVFGATHKLFSKIQTQMEDNGFLLVIKQSDKHKFKITYSDIKNKNILLQKANKNSDESLFQFKTITDIQISIESLIQIIGSFKKDACFSYTKKKYLLKPTNKEYYQNFSLEISNFFTIDSMIKLILLYKKAELDKKNSTDKKSPAPYYLLNYLGFYLTELNLRKQDFLKGISID